MCIRDRPYTAHVLQLNSMSGINSTQPKTTTVQRHELKFFLSRADYEYARNMLRELMDFDGYASADGYPLRSLYFDTIADDCATEKLDGVESRDKFRLRSYGPDYSWVKLERKRKLNNRVDKTSVVLSNEEAQIFVDGDYNLLLEHNTREARSLYFNFAKQYMHPVVLVDYIREPYILPYNDCLLYTSPSPRDRTRTRMPSSA